MKVAGLQHDIVWENPDANFVHLAPMIAAAVSDGARLVVMTEMFATGFSMNAEKIGEPPDGPANQFLVDQARERGVWMCGSIAVCRAGELRPYNELVLVAPDGTRAHYDKIHPFSYSGEDEHYAAGSSFLTVDIEGVRCTFFVCYDLRFADEFWALAAETDCYVLPANWPASRREHWRVLLAARAIENQAYVVGINRVGDGNGTPYVGDSMIVDPFGKVLAEGDTRESVLLAEVDPERVQQVRAKYPFLQDRR